MTTLAICPLCSAPLQVVRSESVVTLSCASCGWNCASARRVWKRRRLLARLLLLFSALALLAGFLEIASDFALPVAIVCLLFGVFIYSGAWASLRNLPENPRERSGQTAEDFAKLVPRSDKVEALFPRILTSTRPRRTQWTVHTWMLVVVFPALIFVPSLYEIANGASWLRIIFPACFCVVILIAETRTYREWKLLVLGEATPGRVVCQRSITSGRYPSSAIFFAFLDRSGRGFIGSGHDIAMTIQEGDPVVVFYDPANAEHSVVLDGYDFTIDA